MIVFTLSSEHVRNTVFTNEQGLVIYKTNTPSFGDTTIHKIKPNTDQLDMRDQFEIMGEIEWNITASTKFRLGGTEVETKSFIPRHGLAGRKRVFTGPDGRSYRWDIDRRVVVLSLNDGSQTVVARSHRATLGIIGRRRKATLEISPTVAHMMDIIIMTFIYVQRIRKKKGGGGG
ncbi:hypothetical protein K503DRAFT_402989 [Rhizopogon vinicolor AM-OR11-026]|uniref:DUF6593 domain-containing protein n=1 Tax=Rhizopogon vinicolor AM-OR11-026 TaxID=1314800 RepID=A0A1B7MQY6_9AGAM|nr:hypothetical protein K503DRAFT_402989 [Rhizopogon vinicolor AM-OR11-026]